MTTVHRLTGCRPEPLLGYLKSLGILRLVSEQADREARGWWRSGHFWLSTTLDAVELDRFFLERYSPSPIVAPWNGGSGFYSNHDHKAVDAIAGTLDARFADYRVAIASARSMTRGLEQRPPKEAKPAMLRDCRAAWRGRLLQWLDATIVIGADGSLSFPALLGTAGNSGHLDFTNNFMQRLAELFDLAGEHVVAQREAPALLACALRADATEGLKRKAVGMLHPGGIGGANAAQGFSGDSVVNPWDFVLGMEGSIAFRSGLSRRARWQGLPRAAAPFAVHAASSGYGSAAQAESAGGSEQWMPLWETPATWMAVEALVREGRADINGRTAERALDLVRSLARLGVARGLTAFTRYGYLKRNGETNLAVPLGRWAVRVQPRVELLDEIAPWFDAVSRAASDRRAPQGFGRCARAIEAAGFECCRRAASARVWQQLLIALGEAEAAIFRSPRFAVDQKLRPLPRLSAHWLEVADDSSVEWRLAQAFAAQRSGAVSIRRHFLPLDDPNRFSAGADRLCIDRAVVCTSGHFEADAIALVRRVVVEMARAGTARFSLESFGPVAAIDDIDAFLAGATDDAKMLSLARALMAVRWAGVVDTVSRDVRAQGAYGLLRLAHASVPLTSTRGSQPVDVPVDPAIVARLVAGDVPTALATAARRLSASGIRPRVETIVGDARWGRRLAASLALPIGLADYRAIFRDLTAAPNALPN